MSPLRITLTLMFKFVQLYISVFVYQTSLLRDNVDVQHGRARLNATKRSKGLVGETHLSWLRLSWKWYPVRARLGTPCRRSRRAVGETGWLAAILETGGLTAVWFYGNAHWDNSLFALVTWSLHSKQEMYLCFIDFQVWIK